MTTRVSKNEVSGELLQSLRFLYRVSDALRRVAKAHSRRRTFTRRRLFAHVAVAESSVCREIREYLAKRGKSTGWVSSVRGLVMSVWGLISARATERFCLQMIRHMQHKHVLVLQNVGKRANHLGEDMLTHRCNHWSDARDALLRDIEAALRELGDESSSARASEG